MKTLKKMEKEDQERKEGHQGGQGNVRGGGCALGAAGAGSVLAQGRNKKASGSQDGFHIKQRIFRHATCLRSPDGARLCEPPVALRDGGKESGTK